ncbi:hypothetical protein EBB07_20700 [Paenibacillaceae bacterium]|nr:hypothetical protein EBB07_20700 [Paenibacillaceae bacterium]
MFGRDMWIEIGGALLFTLLLIGIIILYLYIKRRRRQPFNKHVSAAEGEVRSLRKVGDADNKALVELRIVIRQQQHSPLLLMVKMAIPLTVIQEFHKGARLPVHYDGGKRIIVQNIPGEVEVQ